MARYFPGSENPNESVRFDTPEGLTEASANAGGACRG
jgi:hypothetical protein